MKSRTSNIQLPTPNVQLRRYLAYLTTSNRREPLVKLYDTGTYIDKLRDSDVTWVHAFEAASLPQAVVIADGAAKSFLRSEQILRRGAAL